MQVMQKRLYFLNINLFIIHIVIKIFIINLIYLIKYALQQSRKLIYLFYRQQNASRTNKRWNIMNINQQIEMLESKIDAIKAAIENKQSEIDNFEYEVLEEDFDSFLDDSQGSVNVCGMEFYPSDILKTCDPIAYRCAKSDYESNYDLDDVEEYADLKDELEALEKEQEELESELEDLNDQIDG